MLLTIGLVIAVVSTYVEVKLIHGSSTLRRLYVHGFGRIEGVYFNTAGSFVLSYIIGVMFGATGLTVLFGGIISTGLSQMYFSSEKFFQDNGWSLAKVKHSVTKTTHSVGRAKSNLMDIYHDFRQPIKDVVALFLAFLKVITFPLVLLRKTSASYSQAKAKY